MRAGLINRAEPAAGFHEIAAFLNGETDGLLAINILASVRRKHGRHRVPAIARGDGHRVNVLPCEHVAEIRVRQAILVAVVRINRVLCGFQTVRARVADGNVLQFLERKKIRQRGLRPVAQADAAENNPVAGGNGTVKAEHRAGDN